MLCVAQLWGLVEAVQASQSPDNDELICKVLISCLVNGHDDSVRTHLQLVPVSYAHIQLEVKRQLPGQAGKPFTHLEAEACRPYFSLIPGPSDTQPAVVPILSAFTALIHEQHRDAVVKEALATMQVSHAYRQSMTVADGTDGHVYLSCSAQNRIEAEISACKEVSKHLAGHASLPF